MDARVGGSFRCTLEIVGHTYYAFDEFVEIEPPKRLVFTFGWERAIVSATDSLVTIEFESRGSETEVLITHERLGGPIRALHYWGWRKLLRGVADILEQARAPVISLAPIIDGLESEW